MRYGPRYSRRWREKPGRNVRLPHSARRRRRRRGPSAEEAAGRAREERDRVRRDCASLEEERAESSAELSAARDELAQDRRRLSEQTASVEASLQRRESELRDEELRRLVNEGARVVCVKEDLMRVRVDQEDRSDRLSEEERALKECVASLKGRVEALVKRKRAYMGMEEVVEGRFKAMYVRENESRVMMEEELEVQAKEVVGRAGCI